MKMYINIIALSLIFIGTVRAESEKLFSKSIELATEEYPPFTSAHLEKNGYLCRVVREAFALEKINVVFKFLPMKRSMRKAKVGDADGTMPWGFVKERIKDFYYSKPIYEGIEASMFFLKKNNFDWDHPNPLFAFQEKTIGGIDGANYGKTWYDAVKKLKINFILNQNIETNFKMLVHKRIEGTISEKYYGHYVLKKTLPLFHQEMIRTKSIKSKDITDYHILFSRKKKHHKKLAETFNEGLAKLKKSGRYDLIIKEMKTKYSGLEI